jgi:NADH-quinone oxidoreductase subunit J
LAYLFFIVFSLIAMASAWQVVFSKHIIHAVLWLVVTFFSTACLFVMLGAEFLAAIQVLVYAGAVIILYIFAIMLVEIKQTIPQEQFQQHKRLGMFLAGLILVELLMVLSQQFINLGGEGVLAAQLAQWGGNSQVIGRLLYTDYILPFELISVILLVAIIGAVVLAVSRKEGV